MKFATVVNTEADKIYVNSYNAQGVTVSAGDFVVWSTTSPDGCKTIQPTTALLSCVQGCANENILASGYGMVQAYGYRAEALITNRTNNSIAAGDILIPVNGQDYVTYSAAGDGKTGMILAGEAFASNATPAAALKKVFLRCL